MNKEHVEIFKPATEEDETKMDAEVEATPNCTGKKREHSRSAGSCDPRTSDPALAGGGKTAEPAWLRMAGFTQIASKLNFGGCGNARGEKAKAEEQPKVINPKDSTWDEIVKIGNAHIVTGESDDGGGGGAASAVPNEGKVKKGGKSKPAGQGKITNDLIYAAGRALSVPMEDIETTTNGGVGSARKAGKDLCSAICESLMERGMQTEELLHDLTRRLREVKKQKKQTKKSAALQKNARKVGLESTIEATTLNSGSSSESK